MTTSKNYAGALYAATFAIMLAFTVLPFSGEIWAEITKGSQMDKSLQAHNRLYDMSQATITTFNVDQFTQEPYEGSTLVFLADHLVESELDQQALFDLFWYKEEVNVRIDGNRISILQGDNGEY